ncbi:hypothetical protein [Sandaracinus amylolyticus]|uniref:hypothetical protein n=1 Tax=Sandaracinus amylolyticus TaxID=927083 RepID=UPI001F3CDAC4|nr:hypothetical protein [Sandaracinus amylolyticus]UJR81027.1 Hypothetical protein I5071_30780 [Sandaracinus amylolyticus]
MHRLPSLFLAALLVTNVTACAEGGGGTGGGTDSGPVTTSDAGPREDGGGTRRDASSGTCGAGQHTCGGGCIDDLPNEPENGCRLGCGEACPAPPGMGTTICNAGGECDFECTPPFNRDGDACVCVPRTCDDMGAMCGAPDDGCGTPLDCGSCGAGGSCIDGRCACTPDAREPNDSHTTVTSLGTYADSDDPDFEMTMVNLDDDRDEDWFRYEITDSNTDNAVITVTLDDIPAGSDYRLAAYYDCGSDPDLSTCTAGTGDNMVGRGCASDNAGTASETVTIDTDCDRFLSANDSGTLYVRVTSATFGGSCQAYSLSMRVR